MHYPSSGNVSKTLSYRMISVIYDTDQSRVAGNIDTEHIGKSRSDID